MRCGRIVLGVGERERCDCEGVHGRGNGEGLRRTGCTDAVGGAVPSLSQHSREEKQ